MRLARKLPGIRLKIGWKRFETGKLPLTQGIFRATAAVAAWPCLPQALMPGRPAVSSVRTWTVHETIEPLLHGQSIITAASLAECVATTVNLRAAFYC